MHDTNARHNMVGRFASAEFEQMTRCIALITIALVSTSSVTLAQDAGQRPQRGACRADAQRLCAGIERGGGRIFACLAGQKDKLSDDCRKVLESRGR